MLSSQKRINPLYQTTNQTYGSKTPTVHEMPVSTHCLIVKMIQKIVFTHNLLFIFQTTFIGSRRKFSEHLLKSGMYKENGFNTALNKNQLTGPNEITAFHDRIHFHYFYHTDGKTQ